MYTISSKFYFANPRAQYLALKKEIDAAISEVLNSESYVLGSQVKNFEEEFAKYIGQRFAIGVNSGTDAIILALRALNVGAGDEVIIPSFTAVATAAAVVAVGAIPVYIDIDNQTYNLDHNLLDLAFTAKTKAVIMVHLYGNPADANEVAKWCQSKSLFLIEDCSQSHGAQIKDYKVGTFGILACFSFYPTKNLGGVGDGGAVTTSDDQLNSKLRMLRQYGWAETRNSQVVSQVSRLDELQASILRVKLKHLDSNNNKRIALAKTYTEFLDSSRFVLPVVSPGYKHVFHLYVIQVSDRNKYLRDLPKANIFPGIHYEWPVHLNVAYASKIGRVSGVLTNSVSVAQKVLSLPMYPELSTEEVQYISKVVNNV